MHVHIEKERQHTTVGNLEIFFFEENTAEHDHFSFISQPKKEEKLFCFIRMREFLFVLTDHVL